MNALSLGKLLALTALLFCSACADKIAPSRHTAVAMEPMTMAQQQPTTVSWEQAVAATTTVRVNNASLISMR